MATPINLTSLAFTQPEVQDISRQRKLSEMLLQQGLQGNLKGQMVGNVYVPSHPLEGIADAYAMYKSGKLSKEANAKEQELARQLRETQSLEAKDILGALKGSPEVKETTYGAGMEGPTVDFARPAVAGSTENALAIALRGQSPFAQTMASKLMEQQFKQPKWEKVDKLDAKGNTITGMVDVNSANPESTFREIAISKPALSAKDIAELRDKGISLPYGGGQGGAPSTGGASTSGVSMGGGQGGGQTKQVTGDAKFMPSNLPTYQYNPNLSPQQNRELAGEFEKDLQKNVKNAKNTFELLKDASGILNTGAPSSGMLESMVTGTKQFFGKGGETSQADQKLNMIGGALTMTQPRFEGPQGVLDVKLYEKLAGDLGNANLPIDTRLAAVQQMIRLQKKYYPNGDWDSIDVSGPVMTKQTFLSGEKRFDPVTFRQGLKPQDQEAFDWVRKNPKDPRSIEIKNRLGIQ